jgi:hypothetical protein
MTGAEMLEAIPVVGVADATSVGKLVYLDATNSQGDHIFTLTSTTNGKPLGEVVGYRGTAADATLSDVNVYSFDTRRNL